MISFTDTNDPTVQYPPNDPLDSMVVAYVDPRNDDTDEEDGRIPDLTDAQKKDMNLMLRRISLFLKKTTQKTSVTYDRKDRAGFRELKGLWVYLICDQMNTVTDEHGVRSTNFIDSCAAKSWFSNKLLQAGVFELEPKCGVVLVPPDTGSNLHGLARVISRESHEDQLDRLESYSATFSEKLYRSSAAIHTIVIPVNIERVHWALFVARKLDGKRWKMYWGDSVGEQCPVECRKLLTRIIDCALREKKEWIFPSENYMLDVLGYKRQKDSYSCGAYVVSTMTHFCETRGIIPEAIFTPKHSYHLTEKYRWACAEARIRMVMSISHILPMNNAYTVDQMHLRQRAKIYLARHDGESGQRGVAFRTACEDTAGQGGSGDNSTREGGSGGTAVVPRTMVASQKGVGKKGRGKSRISRKNERVVMDLPGYIYDLVESEGYQYFVQYSKPVTRSLEYGLNLRMRCMKYKKDPPGCGCKAAFMAKALLNGKGWLLTGTYDVHNHERLDVDMRGGKQKRKQAVTATIKRVAGDKIRLPYIHYIPTSSGMEERGLGGQEEARSTDEEDFMVSIPPRPSRVFRTGAPLRDGNYLRTQEEVCRATGIKNVIHIDDEEGSDDVHGALKGCRVARDATHASTGVLSDDSSVIDVTHLVKPKLKPATEKSKPSSVVPVAFIRNGDDSDGRTPPYQPHHPHLGASNPIECDTVEEPVPLSVKDHPIIEKDTAPNLPLHPNSGCGAQEPRRGAGIGDESNRASEVSRACEDAGEHELEVEVLDSDVLGVKELNVWRARTGSGASVEDLDGEGLAWIRSGEGVKDLDGRGSGLHNSGGAVNVASESSASTEELPAEEMVRRGFVAYLEQMEPSGAHEVLQHLQYIGDYFGFKLSIRDSKYGTEDDGRRVLLRGYLKCFRRDNEHSTCPYSFRVRRVRVSRTGPQPYAFIPDFSRAHHNHSVGKSLHQKLSPDMEREAHHLHSNLHLQYDVVLKLIEDKYNVTVNRPLFRKRLKYMQDARFPKEKECLRLYQNLLQLQSQNPRNKVYCRTDQTDGLQYIAWRLDGWDSDYERYGIVPGVSIDCKAIANRFALPLISVNGRDNHGNLTTFFMGYIGDETIDSFVWVLERFKECVRISPSYVAVDQCMALINAIHNVLPLSFVVLDDWHLNQNQDPHAERWCKSVGRSDLADGMRGDMYDLRKCKTVQLFEAKRTEFEQTYFFNFNQTLPRWYKFLYRERPNMLVRCYKDLHISHRFFFQGSGYCESSHARYRNLVLNRDVPFSEVPLTMVKLTQRLQLERQHRASLRDTALRNKLIHTGLPLSTDSATHIIHSFTTYSITKFMELSVRYSSHFKVVDAAVRMAHEVPFNFEVGVQNLHVSHEYPLVVFTLTYFHNQSGAVIDSTQNDGSAFQVYMNTPSTNPGDVNGRCSCGEMTATGIPCAHITRLFVVYNDVLDRWPYVRNALKTRFRIQRFWHAYWCRDPARWRLCDILNLRNRMGAPGVTPAQQGDVDGEVVQIDAEPLNQYTAGAMMGSTSIQTPITRQHGKADVQEVLSHLEHSRNAEISSYARYSDGKSMYDQMHRVAEGFGTLAVDSVKLYLQEGLRQLNAGRYPSNPQIQIPTISSDLLPEQSNGTACDNRKTAGVRNPNAGVARTKKKRKISFQERGSRAKRPRLNNRGFDRSSFRSQGPVSTQSQELFQQATQVTSAPVAQGAEMSTERRQGGVVGTPVQAIAAAIAVVDDPDKQYNGMSNNG